MLTRLLRSFLRPYTRQVAIVVILLVAQTVGNLGFIVVTGDLDCRDADRDGQPGVELSWQGSDEGDDASGRGWAALNLDGTLEGHIYFHLGDESGFRAERFTEAVR